MGNVAASVRQRLLNLSRAQGRPFQEVLQFYVMERFLYRLSRSAQADRFVLKGALMLQTWAAPQSRPTMDIDMLGRVGNDREGLLQRFRGVLEAESPDDGLIFDTDSLRAEAITEDAEYQGVRVRSRAELDGARVWLQIDIGFGDRVVPAPVRMSYPVLLDQPAPELLCYSRESTIAEKFQAMVALGSLNSRMKDFFDIWLLARQFEFDLPTLAEAISATFDQRNTPLPERPIFTARFATEKQTQWQAFLRRLGGGVPAEPEFATVLAVLEDFLGDAVGWPDNAEVDLRWSDGGPWQKGEQQNE